MTELKLYYNPYTLEILIQKKNKKGEYENWENKTLFSHLQGKRLQSWLRASSNYKGFCFELKHAINDDIKILFEGRKIDFLDLEASFLQETEKDFQVTWEKTANFLLSDSYVIENLKSLTNYLRKSPISETKQVKSALEIYQQCMNGQLEVAVIAPMSSGKSTVLNALLGQNLLAMSNKATTAKVTRIYNQKTKEPFVYELRNQNEELIQKKQIATPEKLRETNLSNAQNKDLFYVDIYGKIPEIPTEHINLVLLDTPGPNSKDNLEHAMVTKKVINDKKNHPIILFVMDATKLGVHDEANILTDIKEAINDDPQAKERMIFLVNRSDEIEPKNGESAEKLVESARIKLEKIGIFSPAIIPISAKTAYYQCLLEQNEISTELDEEGDPVDEEFAVLKNFRKGLKNPNRNLVEVATLSPTCREKVQKAKENAEMVKDINKLTWINSGIYGLQCTISEYLEKFAIPYKVCTCISEIQGQLEDLHNKSQFEEELSKSEEALAVAQKILGENEKKLQALSQQCGELVQELDKTKKNAETGKIVESHLKIINTRFTNFWQKYWDVEEVSEDKAKDIVAELQNIGKEEMKSVQTRLIDALSEKETDDFKELHKKIEAISSDFREIMKNYPNYDSSKIYAISSVESVLSSQQSYTLDAFLRGIEPDTFDKAEKRTRTVKNPDCAGMLRFFSKVLDPFDFWDTRYIQEEYEVSVGNHVNLNQLNDKTSKKLKQQLANYAEAINKGMQGIYDEKRTRAKELIQSLEAVIKSESEEVAQCVKRVENNQDQSNQLLIKMATLKEVIANIEQIGEKRGKI